jgi:hypothetical protein
VTEEEEVKEAQEMQATIQLKVFHHSVFFIKISMIKL